MSRESVQSYRADSNSHIGQMLCPEGHMAAIVNHPRWVPDYLPGMVVWVSDIASISTVRWRIAVAENSPTGSSEPFNETVYVVSRHYIVGKTESAGRNEAGSLHVLLKFASNPSAQHEAIHLIQNNLVVVEDRFPTETINVEAL
jgi:hypothetical protein